MTKARDVKSSRPVYLIVADETEEFGAALRYAARAASANGARVAILHVIGDQDFTHWGKIEAKMDMEQRQEAERFLEETARKVMEFGAAQPTLFLEKGDRYKAVLKVLNDNRDITKLILGGDTHSGEPGPLVTYFSSGKGMAKLPVPLTLVPGHMEAESIDSLI